LLKRHALDPKFLEEPEKGKEWKFQYKEREREREEKRNQEREPSSLFFSLLTGIMGMKTVIILSRVWG
jgi:hypothetical protein